MATTDELIKRYKKVASRATEVKEHPKLRIGPIGLMRAIGDIEGIPMGRFVQILGNAGCGKSTLCYDIMAQYALDHPGEPIGYINLERTLDPAYMGAVIPAKQLAQIVVFNPDDGETGLQIAEELAREHDVKLIVIDSIAVLVSKKEYDKDYDENAKVAGAAGMLTRFINRITPILDNRGATVVFVNQYRANFGMSREEKVPFGARAVAYANSLSIDLARKSDSGGRVRILATVKKNKFGSAKTVAEYDIVAGLGIDHASHIIELGEELGVVRKSGAWYYCNNDELKAQGLENAAQTFPIKDIYEKVYELLMDEQVSAETGKTQRLTLPATITDSSRELA